MGTEHTGIPMILRNIQPAPTPVCRIIINKVIVNSLGYVMDSDQSFNVSMTFNGGGYAYYVPITQSQPLLFQKSLQYGVYTVTESSASGFTLGSITPSTFTISAENPQQIVTITNIINLGIVTVSKVITGVASDATYFDILITGQGANAIEQGGQVRIGEPLVFYDLPYDNYIVTEIPVAGYPLTSILPASLTIGSGSLTGSVVVVNANGNAIKYGALFNWHAANDVRNICAVGWSIANNLKWAALSTFLGGNTVSGKELKEIGLIYWNAFGSNLGSTNSSNFNARGAGTRQGTGAFTGLNSYGSFWVSDSIDATYASCWQLIVNDNRLFNPPGLKKTGFSIRLVKDITTLTNGQIGTYTGNDGKVYRTICIGTQEWLADNLCETKYRNGDLIPNVTDNAAWSALTTPGYCWYNNDITNK